MEESDVDEAEAVGESLGEPAAELVAVEGLDSTLMLLRLRPACWGGRAVVLIVDGSYVLLQRSVWSVC